jgi:heme A synthase
MESHAGSTSPVRASARFARFAWGLLAYTLGVVAWGAYVRATGSGAGCGRHWPMCNGEIVPQAPAVKTIVELSHRVTSGLDAVAVGVLAVWAWRAFPKGSPVRRGAIASAVFVAGEVAIGAALVLFELVAHDASTKRALSGSLHLVNTFFLVGALALTAWWASGGERVVVRGQRASVVLLLALAFGAMIVLGASGAVTALGDTLFPARSLAHGLAQDLSPAAHVFVRLRVLHPMIAVMTGMIAVLVSSALRALCPRSRVVQIVSRAMVLAFLVQLGAGLLNLTLLAPVWMQLVHLVLADVVWISLVLLAAGALAESGARSAVKTDHAPISSSHGAAPTSEVPPSTSNVAPVTKVAAGETR